jgi:CubicO group peptidase (beta-lactamase class C family)
MANKITPLNIKLFEGLVAAAMEKDDAAGLAVAVINREGETLYENFFGYRDRAGKLVWDGDTIGGLASVTKSFVALAIMQLVERKVIALEAPVSRYLPQFTVEEVMVHHLLSHSAGFAPEKRLIATELSKTLGLDIEKADLAYDPDFLDRAGAEVSKKLCAQTNRVGRPGENFSYSNDSYALLSEIVRKHGGEPSFTEYVQKNILSPLGMTRTGCQFLWDDPNLTRFYAKRDGVMEGDYTVYHNLSALPGAGNMKSTLNDMKKYILMYLNEGQILGGQRLIGTYAVREMQKPRIGCGLNEAYGYGLRTEAFGEQALIGHGGSLTGVSTNMCWSHETGLGVMVMCNTSGVSVATVAKAAMLLGAGATPVLDLDKFGEVQWSQESLELVCGEYKTSEGAHVVISMVDGSLRVRMGEQDLALQPINRYMLRARQPLGNLLIKVYMDDQRQRVWAIGTGLRIMHRS